MGFPHGHRKTTTLVAGLRSTGMVAPLVIDGPINGEWCRMALNRENAVALTRFGS